MQPQDVNEAVRIVRHIAYAITALGISGLTSLFSALWLWQLLLVSFALLGHIVLSRKLYAQPKKTTLNHPPLTFIKQ
jgi:hypothetical protein